MSKTLITVERVNEVEHHPNADRLDVVQVIGFKVVCGRDQFKVGDAAIYFPPDILIPTLTAEKLGVAKYLKHAIYPGDTEKSQCRVGACRLRGVPSHGFIIGPVEHSDYVNRRGAFGVDVTQTYSGYKYEPPKRQDAGDAESEAPNFHKYTSIENIQRHPKAIPAGTPVRITEKLHGTNCRLGLIKEDGEFVFAAGSHNVRRKSGLYWEPLSESVMRLLTELCDEQHDVVVFGEIFGPGIQDLDYGLSEYSFRAFDISIDGRYMDWFDLVGMCQRFGVETVPLLYCGIFDANKVEELTYGPTTFSGVKSKFKGREGVCYNAASRAILTRSRRPDDSQICVSRLPRSERRERH